MENSSTNYHAPPGLRIGHIHLNVSDLERSISFYHDIMGFDLVLNLGTAAFLSVGGYHHHIGLNTWNTKGAGNTDGTGTASKNRVGLYHFALNYPTRKDLALALKRLIDKKYPINGASDHTSHIALYLTDPDGNGIELACDRDPDTWKFILDRDITFDQIKNLNKALDISKLLEEVACLEMDVDIMK